MPKRTRNQSTAAQTSTGAGPSLRRPRAITSVLVGLRAGVLAMVLVARTDEAAFTWFAALALLLGLQLGAAGFCRSRYRRVPLPRRANVAMCFLQALAIYLILSGPICTFLGDVRRLAAGFAGFAGFELLRSDPTKALIVAANVPACAYIISEQVRLRREHGAALHPS